ncbi:MAG: SDR family oxidoreductase [Armatimonadetes bacterium]|nr:SDR family oxidoreductase [Armatimonadota bacterium]
MTAPMELGLAGKAVIVTAASQGMGFACAMRLAQAGCRVAICGRRADALERARAEIAGRAGADVFALPADLTRADQVARFATEATARFGRLDILVVNTGHIPYGGLEDLTEVQWYEAFELILMSAVRLARHAAAVMRAQGGGDMVFITSSSVREPSPHLLLSNVMRAGVAALAKTMARTLAPHNIRVNTVAPGYFDTGRVRRRIDEIVDRKGVSRDAAAREIAGDMPMGRIGSAEEMAELVAFVVSRRAGYMTGATIQIDGGRGHGLF